MAGKNCEKYYTISYHLLFQLALVSLCLNLIVTIIFRHRFFKNLYIIMLKNWKGINPMGLSASLAEYKNKQYFTNIKKLQKAPRDGVEQGEGERGMYKGQGIE